MNAKELLADILGEKKKENTKYRRTKWELSNGTAWNPLTGYPRNKGCFCGTGIKAKFCCLPKQPRAIKEAKAAEYSRLWARILSGHVTVKVKV